jgi:endoglucanase
MKRPILLATLFALGLSAPSGALTPVEDHGFLKVVSGKLVDQQGQPVQLAGMSLFWSAWAGQFYNRSALSWLAYDWKISVVRIAMGVDGTGMYLDSNGGTAANLRRVDSVMQAAVDLGIYAIVDWHEENAPNHTAQSVAFFLRMARKWGACPNILYEIYNEPHGSETLSDGSVLDPWVWNAQGAGPDIKTYAQTLVDSIRAIDASNLILIGNENWDQAPNAAGADPVAGANLLYTLHFYAGSHPYTGAVGSAARSCISRKIPVFISEWGTSKADGGSDGTINTTEATKWLDWATTNSVSWCNWSVVNKTESSAALLPAADPRGFWDDAVISASGKYVRAKIQAINAKYSFPEPVPPPPRVPDTTVVPGRAQAEGFVDTSGVQTESGADVDGTDDMGWIENGDWADYMVDVRQAGEYWFLARTASQNSGGTLVLQDASGTDLGSIDVPTTGGWQNWTTVYDPVQVVLPAGLQRLRLSFRGDGTASLYNLNWFALDTSLDAVPVARRAASGKANLSGGSGGVKAAGADSYAELVVRDLSGREIGRAPVVAGRATVPCVRPGVVVAELRGPGGREVRRVLAGR